MKIDVIIALLLSTMLSIRMIFWLLKPKDHQAIALGLYSTNRVWIKRIIYFGLFLFLSYLIIIKGSIVGYVLALFAIGSLFDFFFTFFRYPKLTDVKNIEKNKYNNIEIPSLTPIRFYIAIPLIILTAWLYLFVFM